MVFLIQLIRQLDNEALRSWLDTIDNECEAMDFIDYLDDMYDVQIPESQHDRFCQLICDKARVNAAFNLFANKKGA